MTDDLSSLSFEDALNELEKIVHNLETGQQKLEEAIVSYERGAQLRRYCEKKLNEAEARVQIIVKKDDASLVTETLE
ncbi:MULTISPECIES: exodeoxyribonuclease VII small subunit [Commensalibacter]|uniref:Exodeoxyribonuclease 7 small subunit n=2 Tax=Commensalibacter TaxID=1079922 RepID=W7DLW2_9PROT|nr:MULTISPECIES: exodeoxyribonuclease VII small subunit [Commensalibacter]EUK18297.1 exodeoxyribonuclease VII small subunit [Commensalibacter papalotli (ex Servin-Garciduenas et al. 2014)]CAI3936114.1 Exonuclease VII small subunit (XseB) (PDB:1VP7) [Commensalibacter papalotli (ex Botero et al. 2024)]CAI3939557.1 Exonuclease VII small subunit (XseB) (PDB:1VP7) [Commensalibacter papalotli (ex Botero et al. 2024)]